MTEVDILSNRLPHKQAMGSQSNAVLWSCAEKTNNGLQWVTQIVFINLSHSCCSSVVNRMKCYTFSPQIEPLTGSPTKLIQQSDKVIQFALGHRSFT